MDIVESLPKTKRDNEYILILQDQLTKFCMGIPLPDQTSKTIAEVFVNRFISVLGASKAILTDQGRNFISNLMKKVAKIFRLRKFRTTAFHYFHNESLERSHALGEYLKQYVNSQKQWDRWLSLACSVTILTYMRQQNIRFDIRKAWISSNEPLAPNDKLSNYNDYLINLIMHASFHTDKCS